MTVMVPHFAFPFAMSGTSYAVHEQDSVDEIQDCVEVLLLTPHGSRVVLPDYGTPEVLYSQAPANIPAILALCNQWETRAAVTLVETLDTLDQKIAHMQAQIIGGIPS